MRVISKFFCEYSLTTTESRIRDRISIFIVTQILRGHSDKMRSDYVLNKALSESNIDPNILMTKIN